MKDRAVIGKYGNLFGQIGCRQAKCLCHSSHEFWGSEEPWAAARSLCPWHGTAGTAPRHSLTTPRDRDSGLGKPPEVAAGFALL